MTERSDTTQLNWHFQINAKKLFYYIKWLKILSLVLKKWKLSLCLKQEKYLPAWYENNFNLIEL